MKNFNKMKILGIIIFIILIATLIAGILLVVFMDIGTLPFIVGIILIIVSLVALIIFIYMGITGESPKW